MLPVKNSRGDTPGLVGLGYARRAVEAARHAALEERRRDERLGAEADLVAALEVFRLHTRATCHLTKARSKYLNALGS